MVKAGSLSLAVKLWKVWCLHTGMCSCVLGPVVARFMFRDCFGLRDVKVPICWWVEPCGRAHSEAATESESLRQPV